MRLTDHTCRICKSAALDEVENYPTLARVTSDAKPFPPGGRLTVCGACGAIQKLADAAWLSEIDAIYGNFEIYHQSDGAEQPIYDLEGRARPRSARLFDYLAAALDLRGDGALLDFGCGNGAALGTFAAERPGWLLFGSELNDRTLPMLRKVPGFRELFICEPADIPRQFTLITLIHALEHLVNPIEVLAALRGRLAGEGHLFVEVPDVARSPYDLLIADHLLHFTLRSLKIAGEWAGCRTVILSDSVVGKELTWVGAAVGAAGPALVPERPDPEACREALAMAKAHVAWLETQADAAATIAASAERFGIFGTSNSGTWLYGTLRDRVAFFVDEDPGRSGRDHMGLPILSPADIPDGADIYVPLIPDFAAAVAKRLARPAVRFHTPAPVHSN